MIQSFKAAVRRIRIRRILLILVLALVVLLLAGFALRNYLPVSWLQQIRVGSASLPALIAQVSPARLNASPTAAVNTMPASEDMPGVNGSSMVSETSSFPATLTASAPAVTSAGGIVTVITMTPTLSVTATAPTNTNAATATPTQAQATVVPAMATPVPSVTVQPTSTLPSDMLAPNATPDRADPGLSPDMAKIKIDLQDLYQMMQASQVMIQTFQHGQPTEAELAVLNAQLTVVDQRMGKLVAVLQAAQSSSETFGPDARISPEHVRQLIALMRQAFGMVQTVLSGPTTDSAALAQAQVLLEQIQGMMGQIQSLVLPSTNDNLLASMSATLTPTIIPSPTATLIPTATSTQAAWVTGELGQLQTLLSQMQAMLRLMHLMLEQMQN